MWGGAGVRAARTLGNVQAGQEVTCRTQGSLCHGFVRILEMTDFGVQAPASTSGIMWTPHKALLGVGVHGEAA